jgi:hypothetical protein
MHAIGQNTFEHIEGLTFKINTPQVIIWLALAWDFLEESPTCT